LHPYPGAGFFSWLLVPGFWSLTGYLLLATGDWLNRFKRHSEKVSDPQPENKFDRGAWYLIMKMNLTNSRRL